MTLKKGSSTFTSYMSKNNIDYEENGRKILDSKEAAAFLGIKTTQLQYLVSTGKVPCGQIGYVRRFRSDDLKRFKAKLAVQSEVDE